MESLIGFVISFILTLLVFSYLWRDNPAYRFAIHLLVGVTAGYTALIIARDLLLPTFNQLRLAPTQNGAWLIPFLLAFLLLLKLIPRLAPLGNTPVAFFMGVGAAVAFVGSVAGTLIPQITGVGGGLAGLLTALLTALVLFYFQFTRKTPVTGNAWEQLPVWQKLAMQGGQLVLTMTLGAVFAGTLSTTLVLLTERLFFFLNQLPLP